MDAGVFGRLELMFERLELCGGLGKLLGGVSELVEGFGEFALKRVSLLSGLLELLPESDRMPVKLFKRLLVQYQLR